MTLDCNEHPARTPRNLRAILRGLAAVAGLFLSAADELVSALIGIPRMGWLAGRVAEEASDRYRRAAWAAVDAELVDDTPDPPGPSGPGTALQKEGQIRG